MKKTTTENKPMNMNQPIRLKKCKAGSFPRHYLDVIQASGMTHREIADTCNIPLNRFIKLLHSGAQMDYTEHDALRRFVEHIEDSMGGYEKVKELLS